VEPRFRIRAYPTADRYLRRSTLRIALSETTPDNLMRFYDTNIVAARPNLAFMPFGAGPHRCFGAAMGYLQAQFLLAQIHQRFRIQTRPGWASRRDPGLPWPVAGSRPAAPIAPAIAAVSMIPRTCTLPRAVSSSFPEPNRLDAVASVANWAAVSIPPGSRTRTSAPLVAWCTCRAPGRCRRHGSGHRVNGRGP
jgi:Cytochrome P450